MANNKISRTINSVGTTGENRPPVAKARTTTLKTTSEKRKNSQTPQHYLLDLVTVPDKVWSADSKIEDWLSLMTDCALLNSGELQNSRHACPWSVELAVCLLVPCWFMAFNYMWVIVLLAYLLCSWRAAVALLVVNLVTAFCVGNFGALVHWVNGGRKLPNAPSLSEFHLDAQVDLRIAIINFIYV